MTRDKAAGAGGRRRASPAEVRSITGSIEDFKMAAILATGASPGEIEEAVALAAGESDVLGDSRVRPDTVVAKVYEILTADRPSQEQEREG
jgi:hypothetical protein